jgi:hypothetical protein
VSAQNLPKNADVRTSFKLMILSGLALKIEIALNAAEEERGSPFLRACPP